MSQAMQRLAGEGEPVTRAHWFRLFQEADDDNTGETHTHTQGESDRDRDRARFARLDTSL